MNAITRDKFSTMPETSIHRFSLGCKATLLGLMLFTHVFGQETSHNFSVLLGANYNLSSTEFNTTTGIGIFVEPSFILGDKFRLSYRFEPTALAYGVLVLPGGCSEEHPAYPGFPSCREGANYLLSNYLKGEYLFGKPKYGRKGGAHQAYAGLNLNLLTHKRYIITSRVPGNWQDTHKWVANPGFGLSIGALLGRFALSVSFNKTGKDFRDFVGFGLAYRLWGRSRPPENSNVD